MKRENLFAKCWSWGKIIWKQNANGVLHVHYPWNRDFFLPFVMGWIFGIHPHKRGLKAEIAVVEVIRKAGYVIVLVLLLLPNEHNSIFPSSTNCSGHLMRTTFLGCSLSEQKEKKNLFLSPWNRVKFQNTWSECGIQKRRLPEYLVYFQANVTEPFKKIFETS